jgi:hypothetical protein
MYIFRKISTDERQTRILMVYGLCITVVFSFTSDATASLVIDKIADEKSQNCEELVKMLTEFGH